MSQPASDENLRDDLYRVAALLADLERLLYPLPGAGGAGFGVEPNPPPPLPPTGMPFLGPSGQLPDPGGRAGSMGRSQVAEQGVALAPSSPQGEQWVERGAESLGRQPTWAGPSLPLPAREKAVGLPASAPPTTEPEPVLASAKPADVSGDRSEETASIQGRRLGPVAKTPTVDLGPALEAVNLRSKVSSDAEMVLRSAAPSPDRLAPPQSRPPAFSAKLEVPGAEVAGSDAGPDAGPGPITPHSTPSPSRLRPAEIPHVLKGPEPRTADPLAAGPALRAEQPLAERPPGPSADSRRPPEGTRIRPPAESERLPIEPVGQPTAGDSSPVPRGGFGTERMSRGAPARPRSGAFVADEEAAEIDIRVGRDAIPTGYKGSTSGTSEVGPDLVQADLAETAPRFLDEESDPDPLWLAFGRPSPVESRHLGDVGDPRRKRIEQRLARCFLDRVGRRL